MPLWKCVFCFARFTAYWDVCYTQSSWASRCTERRRAINVGRFTSWKGPIEDLHSILRYVPSNGRERCPLFRPSRKRVLLPRAYCIHLYDHRLALNMIWRFGVTQRLLSGLLASMLCLLFTLVWLGNRRYVKYFLLHRQLTILDLFVGQSLVGTTFSLLRSVFGAWQETVLNQDPLLSTALGIISN